MAKQKAEQILADEFDERDEGEVDYNHISSDNDEYILPPLEEKDENSAKIRQIPSNYRATQGLEDSDAESEYSDIVNLDENVLENVQQYEGNIEEQAGFSQKIVQ
uniref:Uncharacterized protein n=1 Tax=Romanomermis culicivorax TaxID=13658 RepID=A0A915HTI1_ROMCU